MTDLADMRVGLLVRVAFPTGRTPHARVARRDDGVCGFEFLAPIALAELTGVPEGED